MQKSFMGKVIGLVSFFMIVLLVLQGVIQLRTSQRHFYQSADTSINQIGEILRRNDEGQRSLTDSLKDDYIIRAQACSYIIENSSVPEDDVQEMKKIAELLEVDEIHIFDLTGSIYAGTNPERIQGGLFRLSDCVFLSAFRFGGHHRRRELYDAEGKGDGKGASGKASRGSCTGECGK